MSKQDVFIKLKLFKKKSFPNSSYLSKYGLYLPASLSIKDQDIKFICKKINNIFKV